jgi:3-dehydroquinate synthase
VAPGLLNSLPKFLRQLRSAALQFKPAARYVIITDSIVKKIAGEKLLQNLKKAHLQADLITFPAGEKNKNEQTHRKLTHALLAKKCGRDTMVLALGGGVVGDVAGYVAATYMRGIPYVQIPTSFLAMVDSSIGGKVGVDTPYGKNLIGAFWHPEAIFIDTAFLKNLPREQLVNGLMEAVKIFLTCDKTFFEFVRKNWQKILQTRGPGAEIAATFLQKIITRAVELKIGVVVRDEHEANERMVLNWGHTIGHAIEQLSGYKILHGYGVALGILVESRIALQLGVLSQKDFDTVRDSMREFGISEKDLQKFPAEKIIKLTMMDKKSRSGKVKYVLLEKIGKVKTVPKGPNKGAFGHEVDPKTVRQALQFFTN